MTKGRTEGRGIAQLAATLIGFAYLTGGLIGLAYTNGFGGFFDSTGTQLYGLFTINPFHNIIHIAVGALLLLCGLKASAGVTEGTLIGVGAFYVVATISGFIYAHIPVIALTSASDPDNYLHLITGLTAIGAGVLGASATNKRRLART